MNTEETMSNEYPIKPGWLTAEQAAELYQVGESTLRYWADEKRKWVARQLIGKTAFYWQDDVEKMTRERKPRNRAGRPRKE